MVNEDLFWVKVEKTDRCWNWTAAIANGYGKFAVQRKARLAHRIAYELLVGPIPEGLDLDHLCRNRRCVNPAHLEPVPRRVNLLRGETITARNAAKTHCPQGHPYDEANTIIRRGARECRECMRIANRKQYERRLRQASGRN